jgi:hypothetical protein
MPDKELPEPGEFTRAFKAQYSGLHTGKDADKKKPVETSGASGFFPAEAASPSPIDPAAQKDLPVSPLPPTFRGPAASSAATPVPPSQAEPGEFTQFFKGGLPGKSAPGGLGGGQRSTYGVQRPNTPMTPRNPAGDNGFNFNDAGRPEGATHKPVPDQYGMNRPRLGDAPDLSKDPAVEQGRAFDFKSLPTPSKQDKTPGEYSALFGKAPIPPAPRQSAMGLPPLAPMMPDSRDSLQGAARDVPPAEPPPRGPSEFTVIEKGRSPAGGAGGAVAPESAPAAASADGKKLPVNINVTPINPLAALPHVGGGMSAGGVSAYASLHGANVSTPLGMASVPGLHVPPLNASAAPGAAPKGMADNTKLIIFFGVLAILAVILMVVVVAMQKN